MCLFWESFKRYERSFNKKEVLNPENSFHILLFQFVYHRSNTLHLALSSLTSDTWTRKPHRRSRSTANVPQSGSTTEATKRTTREHSLSLVWMIKNSEHPEMRTLWHRKLSVSMNASTWQTARKRRLWNSQAGNSFVCPLLTSHQSVTPTPKLCSVLRPDQCVSRIKAAVLL